MTLSWHKSLYWRVALGLIAVLALMLAAEAALFLWTTDRIAGSMPARSPRRLAVLVASDLGTALAADAKLDIEKYVREQYGNVLQPFLVIMRDGRVVANHEDVSQEYILAARAAATDPRTFEPPRFFGRRGGFGGGDGDPDRRFGRGPGPDGDRPGRPEGPDRRDGRDPGPPLFSGPPPDDGPGRFRPNESALIVIAGMAAGRVAMLPGPTYQDVVREFGPTIGLVAGGVLVVGTAVIAVVVFGPTRRRLKQVQDASERLGAGEASARAPEEGGDEVSALARSFNRMADELTSRARALELSDKARRQLLADVSHELMTPLTAMRGYIETLAMPDLKLDAATRERYVGIITDETHRMEHIIGDLLDLARLEGGGTTMRRERVAVATLFDRVASRHEREMAARRITLTQNIEGGAETVIGDPDRLEQAVQNLAANALRHTPDGGRLQLNAATDAAHLSITVRDTGPGVASEHLPFIFDRFYKVDASRKASGGSGLGLSIVKAIVERHGGTIHAANAPDGGAIFTIVLPNPP